MIKTIDRLIEFIEYSGLSARQFDISIGASNGYILRMKKNHASVGSDVIENVIQTYPQLNLIWLITGEGNMLNAGAEQDEKVLAFEDLPDYRKQQIESIIEQKIRERHETEIQELLKEVTMAIQSKKAERGE